MPSISVSQERLCELLKESYTTQSLEKLLFDFGIELDEEYEEDGKIIYKLDVGANRYDLMCAEGIGYALRCYKGKEKYVNILENAKVSDIVLKKEEVNERKAVACGIIRGIDMSGETYESFINYQDKLHVSIGRNRSVVAIGTHDLNKMTLKNKEVVYKSVSLDSVLFTPLNSLKQIRADQLKEILKDDKQLSKHFSLLQDLKKSVVFACDDTIISIPPIINSEDTKISTKTTDIFVEVTGTDFQRVNTALKMILYNFRGKSIESVRVIEDNESFITPIFNDYAFKLRLDAVRDKLKMNLKKDEVETLLERMGYKIGTSLNDNEIIVGVYDFRADVMHECDILEDIAIAYGFNNIERIYPEICTIGKEDSLNQFSEKLRSEFGMFEFVEVLTLTLLSSQENFISKDREVVLENPKSREYQVVRTSLIPGLLKTCTSNQHSKLPLKIFEISDVVLSNKTIDEGAENIRMLSGIIAGNTSQLEDIHGSLSLLLEKCNLKYCYEHITLAHFLENQAAAIYVNDKMIGSMGVIHPNICALFKLPYATSAFEISLNELYNEFSRFN